MLTEGGLIVVEGPIGVGKTTLARRLAASADASLLLEGAEENPFLERFYDNPRAGALPTQLYFLFQRAQQMTALRQGDLFRPRVVADFLMEKDRLFATLTLDDHEFRLYEQVHAGLAIEPPRPDLVIYLQAPVEVLLQRIGRRGRPYERNFDAAFLARLADAYTRFFHYYEAAPLLIVNAATIDLTEDGEDYQRLLARLPEIRSGRHHFNPRP